VEQLSGKPAQLGPCGAQGAGDPERHGSGSPTWSLGPVGWGLVILGRAGAWQSLMGWDPGRVEQMLCGPIRWELGGPAVLLANGDMEKTSKT
jgi:hypothetical protein